METRPATAARATEGGAVDLLRLQVALLAHEGLARSATALATTLCDELRCDRVTVGWLHHRSSRVVGMSHGADFDVRQAMFERVAAAMDEAVQQAASVVLPSPADAAQVAMAHLELAGQDTQRALCTVLLAAQGSVLGAITLERAQPPFSVDEVALCEDAACLAALTLSLKHGAERSWVAATADALRRTFGSGGKRARVTLAATLAALAGALLVPVPYHVAAPARLEGSIQRVVAAPVDGFLEQVNVRPGDAVSAGQVLAELATRDLQARAPQAPERARAARERVQGGARARRPHAARDQPGARPPRRRRSSRSSRTQLHALAACARLSTASSSRATSRSQLGAPVQRGEVLLTVAPNDRFRLIIEVDERDIALVRAGMAGRLALAASPGEVAPISASPRVLPVAASRRRAQLLRGRGDLRRLAARRALRPGPARRGENRGRRALHSPGSHPSPGRLAAPHARGRWAPDPCATRSSARYGIA